MIAPKRIPITFFFNQHQIIGSALLNDNGTLTFTIETPKVIQALMLDESGAPAVLALSFCVRARDKVEASNG